MVCNEKPLAKVFALGLLTVINKKILEKLFALDFANDTHIEKTISKGSCANNISQVHLCGCHQLIRLGFSSSTSF
jgi:hypothetical protein